MLIKSVFHADYQDQSDFTRVLISGNEWKEFLKLTVVF